MLFMHCLSITSYSLFAFLVANTFTQYANSAFMTTAVIAACFVYVACLWDNNAYLTLMEHIENAINKSEKISS